MNNCTLVFDIDPIVLHTNPDTMEQIMFYTLSSHFNIEIHYLYVSFVLQLM